MRNEQRLMDLAISAGWKKYLGIMMLILYELADYTPEGLMDFKEHFWEYLQGQAKKKAFMSQLVEQFEKETGIHLEEVKLQGTAVDKAIKTDKAVCWRIGLVVLWGIADWPVGELRKFMNRCWDYSQDSTVEIRIRKMQNETGVRVFDTKQTKLKKPKGGKRERERIPQTDTVI